SFQGTATFGNISLTSASDENFLAQLDGNGTFQWAHALVDSGDPTGLAFDGSGNVYVAGGVTGTAHLGSTALTSAGDYDILVAQLNRAGDVQWARSFGGSKFDYANGLAVDGSGNVYLAGDFEGTANFGTATFTSGGFDGFLMKLDSTGTVTWAKQLAGG